MEISHNSSTKLISHIFKLDGQSVHKLIGGFSGGDDWLQDFPRSFPIILLLQLRGDVVCVHLQLKLIKFEE